MDTERRGGGKERRRGGGEEEGKEGSIVMHATSTFSTIYTVRTYALELHKVLR